MPDTKTPTVRVQTPVHTCALCGARRRSADAMPLHFGAQHGDAEPTYTTTTSEYGQPASFPVPAGDVVVATDTPLGGTARIVAGVPKAANFELGWNGFDFYTLPRTAELVAVAR